MRGGVAPERECIPGGVTRESRVIGRRWKKPESPNACNPIRRISTAM